MNIWPVNNPTIPSLPQPVKISNLDPRSLEEQLKDPVTKGELIHFRGQFFRLLRRVEEVEHLLAGVLDDLNELTEDPIPEEPEDDSGI